jgi:hypothetical protein
MRRFWILLVLLLTACQPAQPVDSGFQVQFHPDGGLYAGDQVSVQVIPPADWVSQDKQVLVALGDKVLGSAGFGPYGVGQRNEATLWWIWDTKDLPAGDYALTFKILPEGATWQQDVVLKPTDQMPDPKSTWASTTSVCCTLFYITNTDAGRDIDQLKIMVDEQAADVSDRMRSSFDQQISITFLPRLLGHGGFATNGIYVSYLDGDIAGNITGQVIHHEMLHILDASLGGEMRPSMLVEGLAVYMSGGHYKTEALLPRAAALLELNKFIPLKTLANDFYNQQHEIGYLEAGALIGFMVDKYGWEAYQAFYRHIPNLDSQVNSLDSALFQNFDINLAQLEQDFLTELKSQVVSEAVRSDLALTVDYFDSMRHYQEVLDPSAYFLTAWLPDGDTMRQKGIVADFLRGPERLDNRVFEFVLRFANREIASGDYKLADFILGVVDYALDQYP